MVEVKEAYPLKWPASWPRVRLQDRKPQGAWKGTANKYREALEKELTRMGCPSFVVSCNVQVSARGSMTIGVEPLDPGVAVYFSRKEKEDFAWQDALGIHDPAPTEVQVQESFKRLATLYHPDKIGGDRELFLAATKHRDTALRWIRRETNKHFGHVIACDQFKEVRLNLYAIVLTIKAMRQIERCGTSSVIEKAWEGFGALPAYAGAAGSV
jgi:hypothetical protein